MNELTQRAIRAIRAGDRAAARRLLSAALEQDPDDASAWLWMTGALDTDAERIQCLQQVLRIDPNHAAAQRGLAQLEARQPKIAGAGLPPEPAAVEQPAAEAPAVRQEPAARNEPTVRREPPVPASPIFEEQEPQATPPAEESAPAIPLGPGTSVFSQEETAGQPAAAAAPEILAAEQPAAAAEILADGLPADEPAAQAAEPEYSTTDSAYYASRASARPADPALAEKPHVIFRTRPTIVPILAAFWLFLIGAIAIAYLLRENPVLALSLALGLGLVLELIVIYAAVRTLSTRYELTDQYLALRLHGKRVRVALPDVYAVECVQSAMQRLLGAGDLRIDAAVNGELAHLRMRNIPQCKQRLEQIKSRIPGR